MLTINQILKAIDELDAESVAMLWERLRSRHQQLADAVSLTPASVWMQTLERSLEKMREGLSEEEWFELERAMNYEYVEPFDDTP